MNLFNKAIYKNHLEHTAKGTSWGKHKYLYITETGRYVYPEDVAKGKTQQQFRSRQINDQIKSAHTGSTVPTRNLAGTSGMTIMPNGKKSYWKTDSNGINKDMSVYAYENKRNNTSSVKKQEASKTSGVAAGSKSVASNAANRNTITIKKTETVSSKPTTTATAKAEEKKTDTTNTGEKKTDTTNTGEKYKNMSEETKQWLMKNAGKDEKKEGKKSSGKKKGSGSKGSSKSTKKTEEQKQVETNSQTGTNTKSANTDESKQLGLTDDDLKNMEINTEATNRDEVIKNLALKVIRGDFGNGTERKNRLGKFYGEIQKRVNEMLKEKNVVKHDDISLEEGMFLAHFGTKRHSGRFPFGSGARPYQHGGGPSNKRKNSTFGERRSMSDEDLETAINRARKEGELHRLERDNRSQGQKFTEDVLTSIGKTVLTKAATGALLWAGKKFASEVLNDEELGTFIANGGPEKKKK